MVHRSVWIVALCWLGLLGSTTQAAETLDDLLRGIEKAAVLAAPLRADGTAEIDGIAGKKQDRVVILERGAPGSAASTQVFAEFRDLKLRVLALAPGDLHVSTNGTAKAAKPDAALAPTSFSAEDLLPFSRARCAAMRIADLSNDQFTIVCEPVRSKSRYMLEVYKFDRAKLLPVQVLLYKDSMTNLVKMLRLDDFVQVGTSWAPKRMVMQDFKLHTKDVLALSWALAPSAPAEAFDPKSFAVVALPAAAN